MNNNDIYNYIDKQENQGVLEEFLNYLKCCRCGIILLEPKFCGICNKVLCGSSCKNSANCPTLHKISISRITKTLLSNLSFKCKYFSNGCINLIPYNELEKHLNTCKFKGKLVVDNSQKPFINNSNDLVGSSFIKNNSSIYFKKDQSSVNTSKIKCIYCSEYYENNDLFLEHYNTCKNLSSQIDKSSQDPKFFLNLKLSEISDLRAKYQMFNTTKNQNFIDKISKSYESITSNLNLKNNVVKNSGLFDEESFRIKINDLYNKREKLLKERMELEQSISNNNDLMEYSTVNPESLTEQSILKYQISIFQKLISKRQMNNKFSVFKVDNSKCYVCQNNDPNTKKFSCKRCRNSFCEFKCITQCKSASCKSEAFVCPIDNSICKLCHKLHFCDNCKKKCFYQGCKNVFCVDCYKKNEHQARGATVNCNFFTCERDQKNDCLMTSLFCNKCEKRLCNKCTHIDPHNHFK